MRTYLNIAAAAFLFSLWLVACIDAASTRPETTACHTDTECQCAADCLERLV